MRKPLHFFQALALVLLFSEPAVAGEASRLAYLDENDPFHPGRDFPKLTTSQWVGEPNVEAVIILAVDDMRSPGDYENFLLPLVERLKKIDGRAPVSIMSCRTDPKDPALQRMLKDGLSIEVHTLEHPCPLLAGSDFDHAASEVNDCIDLIDSIPGNKAVAYRMPCCDSEDSLSPRFLAEIFNGVSKAGHFLAIDSSIMNITTTNDSSLPAELTTEDGGGERFRKYVPFPAFATTIEDYPYPYIVGKLCWEFPPAVPSDWEAQRLRGSNNPATVADWEKLLDATVLKQGTFTFIFHPHGWIQNRQMVEFVDYAATRYGKKVKFLTFREALERLNKNLLAGQPLRAADGQDNGVRLLDLDNDGHLDVVIGNKDLQKTRRWDDSRRQWIESGFPLAMIAAGSDGKQHETGVHFGVLQSNGMAFMLARNEAVAGGWRFDGKDWVADKDLLNGLQVRGEPVYTARNGHDCGVRLRDVLHSGAAQLLVGNPDQNAVFVWSPAKKSWEQTAFALPAGTMIVDSEGNDAGLRFVDLNNDGYDDVVFSNEKSFGAYAFFPKKDFAFDVGWTRELVAGRRGGHQPEIPMIVRGGPHPANGAWFKYGSLWVQNEDTGRLPDMVDRRTFQDLITSGQPGAKSPQESLASIHVHPGFKVELVASEPLTKSPVAMDWGADGKLWVVEMGDYPNGMDGKGKPGGIVRFFQDTHGDGVYDKSTVFLDGLNFPNGIIAWGKGVLVSAPPEIFYAEDTRGDGRADLRKTLFTGFNEGNPQHRANGFDYGLDNWLYGANGDSGGTVTSLLTGKAIDIDGCDFRFRPDDGALETQGGETQYGRHRDDWGNWFGNNNVTWLWHYYLPVQYLPRNPWLSVNKTRSTLADYPDSSRVFPISPSVQRFNDPNDLNHLTSGCSPMSCRDELFGPAFSNSVFICEPANNLIHREVLEPDGVTFTSHRAADEGGTEFFASTDNWSRFVQAKFGPDGALYIADMYRLVIEHPEWIPEEIQKQYDLRAGAHMGRIYRVYPKDATLRKIPRLDRMKTEELAHAIDSPSGWQRDTAQQLLVQSGDKSAARPLAALIATSARPAARMQGLCALDGLHAVTPDVLLGALKDPHPGVREQAVRISESLLTQQPEKVVSALLALTNDPAIRVRYQLAFTLGWCADPRAGAALAALALGDADSRDMEIAVMSSATNHVAEMLDAVFSSPDPPPGLMGQLFGLATAMNKTRAFESVLAKVAHPSNGKFQPWQTAALAGFLDALALRQTSLAEFRASASVLLKQTVDRLDALFAQARREALDDGAPESDRLRAIRLLGRGTSSQDEDFKELAVLLGPLTPALLQEEAIAALKANRAPDAARVLLSGWKGYFPEARLEVMNALMSRTEWMEALLAALEQAKIPPGQIATAFQQKLLTHPMPAIRHRAANIFAAANPDRKKLVQRYQIVNKLKGDPLRGATLFQQNCTPCHRLNDQGHSVGPDLGSLSGKSVDTFLIAILDPNQAVESRYISYNAVTKDDRDVSGVIASETPTSITLKSPGGAEEVILRSNLKELTSSGLSLMPDGLEKALDPQAMADLIAFISSNSPPKVFAGNAPLLIDPKADGTLSLLAGNCKIYGDTLVYEDHYQNLGYWQSETDRAVWALKLPRGGKYDVWFDWALPADSPNNSFCLESGESSLTARIPKTGSWDDYQQAKLGSIQLQAGRQNVELRGERPVEGALLDLREIRLVPSGQPAPADFLSVQKK